MASVIETFEIKGLIEIKPDVFGDSRGYFFESYNKKYFEVIGLIYNCFKPNNFNVCVKSANKNL